MIKESLSCQKSATNISSQSTLNRRESKENRKVTNEIYNYDELNEFDDCIIEKENLNHIIEKEVKLFDSQEIESCSQPKDFNSHAMILNSQLKDENSQPKLLNSQTKEDKSEIKEKNNMFGEYKDIFEEYNLMYTTEKGKLYQVDFSGKRKHILNYPDLYMSKCIYLPNGGLYVIGGSNTKDLETATNKVIKFDMPDLTPVVQKPMISKRSSFGCTLSKDKKTIFVVGGYSKSYHTFDKCEIYNIRNNLKLLNILNALYLNNLKSTVWISLPSLHECLANTSLCQFTSMANKREYLYCFGGIFCQIVEKEEKTCLSKSIERLDLTSLNTINPEWEMLKVKLNYSACDIGSFQISENRILIYGGWDGDSISTVSEYNPDTHDEISEIDTKLDTSDFFLTNGIVSRSVSKQDSNIFMFRFLGQKSLHEVDTLSYVFNSFSLDN